METMKGNDVFNYVMKNYYFVKLDLILPESRDDKGCIEFNIIYINDEGSEVMVQQEPEVRMIPVPASIFMLVYIKLVEAIITKDNGVSKDVLIENSLHPEHEPKLDYPNEYTMWHLNWYKHSYQFLQPFHSYNGAKLRLSYLLNELIEEGYIDPTFIEKDDIISQYTVIIDERLDQL